RSQRARSRLPNSDRARSLAMLLVIAILLALILIALVPQIISVLVCLALFVGVLVLVVGGAALFGGTVGQIAALGRDAFGYWGGVGAVAACIVGSLWALGAV